MVFIDKTVEVKGYFDAQGSKQLSQILGCEAWGTFFFFFFVHSLPAELLPNVKNCFLPVGVSSETKGERERMNVYDATGMVCPRRKFLTSLCR